MAITPADPPQGLQTGPLEGAQGGLSAMPDYVAKGYGEDIIGRRGPENAAKAVQELIGNALSMFAQEMTFSCGSGAQVIGNGAGQFAIRVSVEPGDPATRPAYKSATLKPWDLVIVDGDGGEVSVNVGTILKDESDATDGITITNAASTFTPDGTAKWIYLKVEDLATPTVTLENDGNWPDYPSYVEVSSSGATAVYEARYLPLFHFRTTAADGYKAINSSLFYRKVIHDFNLELIYTNHQTGTNRPLVVHKLIPGVEVLP